MGGIVQPRTLPSFLSLTGNTDMQIWQRGIDFNPIADQAYGPDMWRFGASGTGTMRVQRGGLSSVVPGYPGSGIETSRSFNYVTQITVVNPQDPILAPDFFTITQPIIGYNAIPVWRQPFIVYFYAYLITPAAALTPYTLSFFARNSNGDRSYVKEFTLLNARWSLISFTVPASPFGGTWNFTTGIGLQVGISLSMGSDRVATAEQLAPNDWLVNTFLAGPNQMNFMLDAGNIFRCTGFGVFPLLAPALPVWRNFQEELQFCQAFYQKSFPYATTPAQAAGLTGAFRFKGQPPATPHVGNVWIPFSPRMAFTPTTVTSYNPQNANALAYNTTVALDYTIFTPGYLSETGFSFDATGPAGSASTNAAAVHWTAEAYL